MTARLTMLAAGAMAIAAVAAGCGGGGGSTSDSSVPANSNSPAVTTSSLSKAQFVEQANAACTKERKDSVNEILAFTRKYESEGKPESKLLVHVVNDVILPRIEREIAAVAKLGAPAGDEGSIEAILGAETEAVEKAAALENAKSLEQIEAQFAEAGKLARAYGIPRCDNS